VYPAVTVLVESEDKGKGYAWNGNFKSSSMLYGLQTMNIIWNEKSRVKNESIIRLFRHILCTCSYVPHLQYRRLCRKSIVWYSSMGENLRFNNDCKFVFMRCLSSFYYCSQEASHGS